LVLGRVIARDSVWDAVFGMSGGFGVKLGVGATAADLGTQLSREVDEMECG
jgi:hypothetical protein